jgi:hypothetical protein
MEAFQNDLKIQNNDLNLSSSHNVGGEREGGGRHAGMGGENKSMTSQINPPAHLAHNQSQTRPLHSKDR